MDDDAPDILESILALEAENKHLREANAAYEYQLTLWCGREERHAAARRIIRRLLLNEETSRAALVEAARDVGAAGDAAERLLADLELVERGGRLDVP